MSKLPKAKRDRLILVGTGTLIAVAVLWFMVIADQRETMARMEAQTAKIREKMTKADQAFKMRGEVEKNLQGRMEMLRSKESEMAPEEDPYVWMLEKINQFAQGRQIEFFLDRHEFKHLEVLPTFTYRAAVFKFTGKGSYGAIGRFIADFENEFRLFQIRNISVKPMGQASRQGAVSPEDQTLGVEFEIVALVRPAASTTSK